MRIEAQRPKQRIGFGAFKATVLLAIGALEPLERLSLFAAPGVDARYLVRAFADVAAPIPNLVVLLFEVHSLLSTWQRSSFHHEFPVTREGAIRGGHFNEPSGGAGRNRSSDFGG